MNDLLLMQASKLKVFDGFNRADGALGNADTGQAWQNFVGGLSILNGQAYDSSPTTEEHLSVIDAGIYDCTVSVQVVYQDVACGCFVRLQDPSNHMNVYLHSNALKIDRVIGGEGVSLGVQNMALVSGTTYTIITQLTGARILANVPELSQALEINDANVLTTKTQHGIFVYNSTAKFDNFTVRG